MKKCSLWPINKYLTSLIAFILISSSCSRDEIELDCAAVNCIALMHYYSIDVIDVNGNPVALDKYVTIRERKNLEVDTQSKLDNEADIMNREQGNYPVLDDTHDDLIKYEDEKFTFQGYIRGKLIVSADFIFSKNCCGIIKISGPEEYIVD